MMMSEDRRSKQHFDYLLLINMYVLMMIGVLLVSVATYNPAESMDAPLLNKIMFSESGRWQAIFTVASLAVVWFVISIPYVHFKTFARYYHIAVLILLLLVLGVNSIRNVRGWFRLALGRMLQPSEFAKLTLILMLAKTMEKNPKPMSTLPDALRIISIIAVPAVMTFIQGETGTVIVLVVIFFVMLAFGGVDWKWLMLFAALATIGIGSLFAYGMISGSGDYRLMRLLSFLDPTKYDRDAGYQILHSQQAIGSGGMTGVGVFVVGSLSQLNYVPEGSTDFIFATLGESVGFVGSFVVIALYFFMIIRLIYLARYTYDPFGRLVIIGVMAMIFIHVFQNIGMTLGLMPITGIPLPFLSYGGSNLLTNVVGIALVLNVVKNRSAEVSDYKMSVAVPGVSRKRGHKKIYVNRIRRSKRREAAQNEL